MTTEQAEELFHLRAVCIAPGVFCLECKPITGDRAWLIHREGGAMRTVEFGPHGRWFCNCPGWRWRNRCAHVEAIKERIA